MEEDEHVQEMWANLFVNYVDSNKNLSLTVYLEVLRQISTDEVKSLKYSLKNGPGVLYRFSDLVNGVSDDPMPYTDEQIANLIRLGLFESEIEYKLPREDRTGNVPRDIEVRRLNKYKVTDLRKDFLKACERNPS